MIPVSMAARIEAWQDEFGALPGLEMGAPDGGTPLPGAAFLPDELVDARLVVEVAWGANLTADSSTWSWFDVSGDVLASPPIGITMGRGAENQTAPPASLSLTLDNRLNAYSQFNPLCSNYPNVREGTPIRVRLLIGGTSYTRFQGRVIGWQPAWDETGNYAVAQVTAAGITRTLSLPGAPNITAIYKDITGQNPVAYWPLDDGATATFAASAVSGVPAMVPYGQGLPVFAGITATLGLGSQPNFAVTTAMNEGGSLRGTIPNYGVSTSWAVEFTCRSIDPATPPTDDTAVIQWWTPGASSFYSYAVYINPAANGGGADLVAITSSGSQTFAVHSNQTTFDGLDHHFLITATQSGGNINYTMAVDGVSTSASLVGTMYAITTVDLNPPYLQEVSRIDRGLSAMSNVAVYSTISVNDNTGGMNGHPGETPDARLSRVCGNYGIPFNTLGYYSTTSAMGTETQDTLLNVIRSCEVAENGWVYDGLTDGISFMAPSQRYDQFIQFTLDGTAGQIVPPFGPLPDDFARVNRSTVSRINGSSATFEDDTGPVGTAAVGTYDNDISSVNYDTDTHLLNRASWTVHQGTYNGHRFPTVVVNMRKVPGVAASVAAMYPGLAFSVVPPYSAQFYAAENINLVAEGWTETLWQYGWDITFNCSTQDVWQVWKIGDANVGRCGVSGYTIAAPVNVGDSTISLAIPTGSSLWTTAAGDFPLYLNCGGVKVKVTAISGSSSPQTATVDSTTVTKALAVGDSVTVWKNGVIAL